MQANFRKINQFYQYVIGIDEAGRGPLAGPVVVAGIKLNSKCKIQNAKLLKDIKDSKKLTPKRREEWFYTLTAHPQIKWAVAKVFPKTIDRINIARSTNLGATRVYKKLAAKEVCFAMLDGSLSLAKIIPHEIIIKGDEKVPVIAAASIIAKVTRDRIMCRLHKKYPQYRFDIHKGYGTKMHMEFIRKFGRSDIHRRSFAKGLVL